MKWTRLTLSTTACALALAAGLAEAKTLRIGAQADAGTMDPHAQNIQTTITVLSWAYEALVTRDRDLAKAPQLATSWEAVEPNVWRFTLREGVTFHDGAAFTAEDVVASIERAKAETSQFKGFVASIVEMRTPDPLTIEFVTEVPDPLLPDKMTYIFIMDSDWIEANAVARPQDLTRNEESFAVLNANGTGPFRLVSREPDNQTTFARFEGYWGETDGDIDEVVLRPISSDPTRISALLSGELDLVIDVPAQNVAQLEGNPDITLAQADEFRTLFFAFDLGSETLRYGDAGGANPFKDPRVRKAVNMAIDPAAIQRAVMRGLSTPTGQVLAPGNVGYDPALDARDPGDLDAAKALLAEAGYPDGFRVTLDCPNNRYINDEAICRAATGMLTRLGIEVDLNLMPRAQYFPKLWERDTSFHLMGFNSPYFDGMYMLETMLMSRDDPKGEGIYNYSNFSDAEYDAMIAEARAKIDPAERQEAMAEIYARVREDNLFAPIHHQVLVYAMRPNVGVSIRPDNWLEIRWVTMD